MKDWYLIFCLFLRFIIVLCFSFCTLCFFYSSAPCFCACITNFKSYQTTFFFQFECLLSICLTWTKWETRQLLLGLFYSLCMRNMLIALQTYWLGKNDGCIWGPQMQKLSKESNPVLWEFSLDFLCCASSLHLLSTNTDTQSLISFFHIYTFKETVRNMLFDFEVDVGLTNFGQIT